MVYNKKFVAVIKANGKVLRESSDVVTLPFGSEYSILLKNLDSVKVQVKVSIDGTDATEGTWLVIDPNSSLELERFIRNGNLKAGNRFKFIERTGAIEENRGIKIDDGLIRIEYRREKLPPKFEVTNHYHYDHYWPYNHRPYWYGYPWNYTLCNSIGQTQGVLTNTSGGLQGSISEGSLSNSMQSSQASGNIQMAMNCVETGFTKCADLNDNGITVPGSESHQEFYSVSGFQTEDSEVLIVRLRGVVGNNPVQKPITVDLKLKCSTCGKTNKAVSKFCSECGTALSII